MKKLILSLAVAISLNVSAQMQPALPNTCSINTDFPDTTGYIVKTVGPGKDYTDLQQAIDAAQLGWILKLDAGVTFAGSFNLPNKTTGTGWVIIISSQMSSLPTEKNRVSTANVSAMPKIITTNTSGLPTFYTSHYAHHYRLVGLEITVDNAVQNSYGLVLLGGGYNESTPQDNYAVVPYQLIIDRCYIHGHTNATIMKFGVRMDCKDAAVIDSYISDFHSIGYDAQAIAGYNGPGPFKIINNYLEGSGENIIFGGAPTIIPGLVPGDIEVRRNYFYKPYTWKMNDASYAGNHWTIKNLFELKTGKRVLLDGNIMENSWSDIPIGQSGYAILLTVRAEGGGSPQADVSDITITNNIIRHCAGGISLSGHDDQAVSLQSQRIRVANNLFEDIDGSAYGDGNIYGPNDGTFLKQGDPDHITYDHNTVFQTGAITWLGDTVPSIRFTNNIFNCYLSAGGYAGMYGPGFAWGGDLPMAARMPNITDANKLFNKNVLIAGDPSRYTNYTTTSTNYFPAATANVNFINFAGGPTDYHNYALSGSSAYKNAASDGTDIGVNFTRLDSSLNSTSYNCVLSGMEKKKYPKQKFNVRTIGDNSFVIQFDADTKYPVQYNIYSITGQITTIGKFENNYQLINLQNLQSGMYFLKAESGKSFVAEKIVVR